MKKKREETLENASDQSNSERAPEGEKITPRLSVQLAEDGSISWERMRPETRDKLQSALSKSNVVPFTTSAAPAASKNESIPPEICELLYDSLSMLMIGLARRGGYDQEQAQVLAFNSQEKHALVPATIRVLDKYNASLGKYAEEIILGTMLTTVITGKLTLLKKRADIVQFPSPSTPAPGSQEGNTPA